MGRISLTKKYTLAGLADGWTEEHYMVFVPFDSSVACDYSDDVKPVKEDDDRTFLELFKKYAKQQFKGGKILVGDETVDAEAGDIDDLPASVLSDIFSLISRSHYSNPKA